MQKQQFAFKYSEGRKLHWVLLLFADRVNVMEGALESLLRGRPHNPLKEMGLAVEFRDGGFRSRFGQNRVDVRRQKRELIVLGIGAAAFLASRAIRGRKAA